MIVSSGEFTSKPAESDRFVGFANDLTTVLFGMPLPIVSGNGMPVPGVIPLSELP
jgi:hypothetical protein